MYHSSNEIDLTEIPKGELWKESQLYRKLSLLLCYILGCTITIAFFLDPPASPSFGNFILCLAVVFFVGGIIAAVLYGLLRTIFYRPNDHSSSLFFWFGVLIPLAFALWYYWGN